jgi:predicted nucleotidyltransferase component of viral defense system
MASKVSYLFQTTYFRDIINTTALDNNINNSGIVEKDYFVTEALRLIQREFASVVIFKGGTSLSKGWNLINRFSEDIDLYVEPSGSDDETLERFQQLADRVSTFPGFTGRSGRKDNRCSSWTEEFTYESKMATLGGIRPVVLLEAGVQSAAQPVEVRNLTSLIAHSLNVRDAITGTVDRDHFPMKLLHFRRTFVEKLFTLHSRVERSIKQNRDLGRDARHYYDLAMLINQRETQTMLASREFSDSCGEYRNLTATFYPGQVKYLPDGMNLHNSPALFPDDVLRRKLMAAYIREAETLCYGPYPAFDDVLKGFVDIREFLNVNVDV